MMLALKVLAAFLIGSIPFAKLAMLGTGIDITKVGSKNPGFNNVRRVSNWRRASIALIGDIAKGVLAVWLFGPHWLVVIAPVVGHCWSPWLRFNGGKGVATTVGVMIYMQPWMTLACLPLYPALRCLGRKMRWEQEGAIASMSTILLLSLVVRRPYAYAMLAIVIIRHIPNIRDIIRPKRESRAGQAKSQRGDVPGAHRQPQ